jgi:hypothetical protein
MSRRSSRPPVMRPHNFDDARCSQNQSQQHPTDVCVCRSTGYFQLCYSSLLKFHKLDFKEALCVESCSVPTTSFGKISAFSEKWRIARKLNCFVEKINQTIKFVLKITKNNNSLFLHQLNKKMLYVYRPCFMHAFF